MTRLTYVKICLPIDDGTVPRFNALRTSSLTSQAVRSQSSYTLLLYDTILLLHAVVLSFVGFMSSSFRIATTAEIENKLVKPRIARAVERGCKLKKLKKTLKVQILDVF